MHRSPLTQGGWRSRGVEIESNVVVEWTDVAKFLVLRNYIQTNYDFNKSSEDESDVILEKIKVMSMILDDKDHESDNEEEDQDDPIPILMEAESD